MSEPITVIITCYNLEQYIGKAIESVLAQSYHGEVEILVVDDCSVDESAAIISRYPRVQMLRTQQNSGVLLATVLGLREATHDIVTFLDGDDVWARDKVEAVADAFSATPGLGLTTHDLNYVDANGGPLNITPQPSRVIPSGASPDECDQLIRDGILEQRGYVWLGSAFSIRRSSVDADGFCDFVRCLPDPRNTYQDWPLAVWCAARQDARMGYIPRKLFNYRLHQANHSGDARTPAKATRNVKRTLNTLLAIEEIIHQRGPVTQRASHAILRKRKYYQYLLDLYAGKRAAASRGFLASQEYVWKTEVSPAKEFARFVGVQVLGLGCFLRWVGYR